MPQQRDLLGISAIPTLSSPLPSPSHSSAPPTRSLPSHAAGDQHDRAIAQSPPPIQHLHSPTPHSPARLGYLVRRAGEVRGGGAGRCFFEVIEECSIRERRTDRKDRPFPKGEV